jgi:hypothetical protein
MRSSAVAISVLPWHDMPSQRLQLLVLKLAFQLLGFGHLADSLVEIILVD